jgi:hypothetical protein
MEEKLILAQEYRCLAHGRAQPRGNGCCAPATKKHARNAMGVNIPSHTWRAFGSGRIIIKHIKCT